VDNYRVRIRGFAAGLPRSGSGRGTRDRYSIGSASMEVPRSDSAPQGRVLGVGYSYFPPASSMSFL
jgi:hypothetical protein